MYTVCPKCALTLVVTAADLRVAQGYVRCGRCSSVFNALAQLSDERGAARSGGPAPAPASEPEPEPEPAPAPPARPAAARPTPAGTHEAASPKTAAPAAAPAQETAIPEDALEFDPAKTDASSVFVDAPPNPEWTAATGSFKALVAANQEAIAPDSKPAAGDDDVDVELDAALLSDIVEQEPRVAPSAPPPIPAPAAAPSGRAAAVAPQGAQRRGLKPAVAAAAAAVMRATHDTESESMPPPPPAAQEPAPEPRGPFEPDLLAPPRPRAQLWAAGAALLALVLIAQVINHQRDALAADPRFSGPITALYGSLGIALAPHWDLHAYDVRQLGATVVPGTGGTTGGTITVRASIHNAGAKPQPLPLLRVTLQDRFGNRLASRDVAPRDYLPRSIAPTTLMSVDQRIDAELAFVDPGSSAVGFELDACLPVRGGVACANDVSSAR